MKQDRRTAAHLLLGTCVAALLALAQPVSAQEKATPEAVPSQARPAEAVAEPDPSVDLDVLVAPIALFPDPLLAAVLQASVVPVDVIAASQFLDAYETDKSLEPNPEWDPAVIGLLGFPTVLRAMAANMDWVEAAGDAVLEDLKGVQTSVQQDRAEFHAAGVLKSDDKQNVIVEADIIRIEPADPQVIYLPIYDPTVLVEAIRSGDASSATQAAAPSEAAGDAAKPDATAEAVAAAEAAKAAAQTAQQAAAASQDAAAQSAGSASQAAGSAAAIAAAPATEAAPMSYAAAPAAYPPVTYAAPVTYAPPVAYPESSSSGSIWPTVGTFAGGALVGGILGYVIGDDDDDNDGWWDDDDDIHIDSDDLDDYLDDRRRDREDARDDWQGFADDAREDRQAATVDRQDTRQAALADRSDDQAARRDERAANLGDRRDQRSETVQGGRDDRQERAADARGQRQENQARDERLKQQRNDDAKARLDSRAQKSPPLVAREAKRTPSPVKQVAHAGETGRKATPTLDVAGTRKPAGASTASLQRPQSAVGTSRKVGSSAATRPSAIGGVQRGQTAKKEARGAKSRQQAVQRPAPQRQASRAAAPTRQAAASRPAQRSAMRPSGGNRAAANGNRGKGSRGGRR
jgi:hypothetical protein